MSEPTYMLKGTELPGIPFYDQGPYGPAFNAIREAFEELNDARFHIRKAAKAAETTLEHDRARRSATAKLHAAIQRAHEALQVIP